MTESAVLAESDEHKQQESAFAEADTRASNHTQSGDPLTNTESTNDESPRPQQSAPEQNGIHSSENLTNDNASVSGTSEASSKRTMTKEPAPANSKARVPSKKMSGEPADTVSPVAAKTQAEARAAEQAREEKRRAARERYEEQHRRRIAELLEARRVADELYERLAADRRRRIEEARLRDEARRRAVQERRAQMLAEQREKLESWLRKMAERESRRSEMRRDSTGSKRRSVSQSASRNLSHANSRGTSQPGSTGGSRVTTGGVTTPVGGLVSASASVSTGLHNVANDRMTQSAYGTLPHGSHAPRRVPTPLVSARRRPDAPTPQPVMTRSIAMSVRELHAAHNSAPVTTRSVSTANVAARAARAVQKPAVPPSHAQRSAAARSKSVGPVRPSEAPSISRSARTPAAQTSRSRSAERKHNANAISENKMVKGSIMSRSVIGALPNADAKPTRVVAVQRGDKQSRRPAPSAAAPPPPSSFSTLVGPPSIITISRQNAAANVNVRTSPSSQAKPNDSSTASEQQQAPCDVTLAQDVREDASASASDTNTADKRDVTETANNAMQDDVVLQNAPPSVDESHSETAPNADADGESDAKINEEEAAKRRREEEEQEELRRARERQAQEEAERRVKEEAERRERNERERVEALRRIEEERARTKERVSAIMKRVKGPSTAGGSPGGSAGLSNSPSATSLSTSDSASTLKALDGSPAPVASVNDGMPTTNGGASLSGSTSGLSSAPSSSHSPAREQDINTASPRASDTNSSPSPDANASRTSGPILKPVNADADTESQSIMNAQAAKITLLQATPNGYSNAQQRPAAFDLGDEEPDEIDSQALLDARIASHKTVAPHDAAPVSLADELALFGAGQPVETHADDDDIL